MKIKTAGLIVELNVFYDLLKRRIEPYIYYGEEKTDFKIEISEKFYFDKLSENPNLSVEECEYIWSSAFFYEKLTAFGGMMLHASCVEYNKKAFLFSADSGTGKSTHTHLWLKYLPGSRIINDDKPAIRKMPDGKFYAFGTPWSGKTDESINEGFPIAGIAFLSRGENKISRVSGIDVLKNIFDQTVRPSQKNLMADMMVTLDGLLTEVPVYRFSCDMSEAAVLTSYNEMK